MEEIEASVTSFFYRYVKEIRLSLSVEDSYWDEGGFCSDFFGRKQIDMEPTEVQTISKADS